MQEITAPLTGLPDDPVPLVSEVDFPVVMRGYDRGAVDAYVRRVTQLVGELAAMRSPEAAVRRALERVGEEVSGILQRAHETAAEISAKARQDAEERLVTARQEASSLHAAGEARAKELDAETDRIWAERHRIVEDARQLAGQLLALAESASERFPAEEPAPEAAEPEAVEDDTTAPTTVFAAVEWEGEPGDFTEADEEADEESLENFGESREAPPGGRLRPAGEDEPPGEAGPEGPGAPR